jgi:hypothetical protein
VLSERELDLATREEELEARERQLNLSGRNRDQLTAMLRKQLAEEFGADLASRDRENQKLKAKLAERGEQLDRAQAELDEYADFTEMLQERAPSDLLAELDDLRHDNRELKRTQMDLEVRNAADETDDLRRSWSDRRRGSRAPYRVGRAEEAACSQLKAGRAGS